MIQLKPFRNKAFLKEAISVAFNGDDELKDYHISPSDNYQDMINHTYDTISTIDKSLGVKYYAIVYEGKTIGFTCTIPAHNWVYSFGIDPKYRNKNVLLDWLKTVERLIGGDVFIYLYSINSRAINFFEKNGYHKAYDFLVFDGYEPITILVKPTKIEIVNVHDVEFEHGQG